MLPQNGIFSLETKSFFTINAATEYQIEKHWQGEMHSVAPTHAYLEQSANISDVTIVVRLCLSDMDI